MVSKLEGHRSQAFGFVHMSIGILTNLLNDSLLAFLLDAYRGPHSDSCYLALSYIGKYRGWRWR